MPLQQQESICYICHDDAGEHGFIPPNCNCQGTIAVHEACIAPILRIKTHCSICKSIYIPPDGPYTLFWENTNNIRKQGTVINGTFNGMINTFYKSGELLSRYFEINGQKNGIAQNFYRNGQIKTETTFVENNIEGIERAWNEDGTLDIEIPYVNGKIEGIVKYYWPNGSISGEEMWTDNLPHGLSRLFNEDGSIEKISLWVDGNEHFSHTPSPN